MKKLIILSLCLLGSFFYETGFLLDDFLLRIILKIIGGTMYLMAGMIIEKYY